MLVLVLILGETFAKQKRMLSRAIAALDLLFGGALDLNGVKSAALYIFQDADMGDEDPCSIEWLSSTQKPVTTVIFGVAVSSRICFLRILRFF
jgi:hypothetical protein